MKTVFAGLVLSAAALTFSSALIAVEIDLTRSELANEELRIDSSTPASDVAVLVYGGRSERDVQSGASIGVGSDDFSLPAWTPTSVDVSGNEQSRHALGATRVRPDWVGVQLRSLGLSNTAEDSAVPVLDIRVVWVAVALLVSGLVVVLVRRLHARPV